MVLFIMRAIPFNFLKIQHQNSTLTSEIMTVAGFQVHMENLLVNEFSTTGLQ